MMRYSLTKNEAKVLRALNDYPDASLYEIASISALAPPEVSDAAKQLAIRELLIFNEADLVLRLTPEGRAVQKSLITSSRPSSRGKATPDVSIVSEEEAASEAELNAMSPEDFDSVLNEEMEKLSSSQKEGE